MTQITHLGATHEAIIIRIIIVIDAYPVRIGYYKAFRHPGASGGFFIQEKGFGCLKCNTTVIYSLVDTFFFFNFKVHGIKKHPKDWLHSYQSRALISESS